MNQFNFKKVMRMAVVILIAMVVAYFYRSAEAFWIPLSAVLVMQGPIGSAVYYGLKRFVVIVVVVIIGTFLEPSLQADLIYARVNDVVLGGAIGLMAELFFFPSKPDVEFRLAIIPILNAYADYLMEIKRFFLHEKNEIDSARLTVEKLLQRQIPEWVYASGFSVAFRQGHRHFLVTLEKIGHLLFALHRDVRHEYEIETRRILWVPFADSIEKARDMLLAIDTVLKLNKLEEGVEDFAEELVVIEEFFRKMRPPSLELLDFSVDYRDVAALQYDLKDLRILLLKLIEALR